MELNENAVNAIIGLIVVWYLGMVTLAIKYGGHLDSCCKDKCCNTCILYEQDTVV